MGVPSALQFVEIILQVINQIESERYAIESRELYAIMKSFSDGASYWGFPLSLHLNGIQNAKFPLHVEWEGVESFSYTECSCLCGKRL